MSRIFQSEELQPTRHLQHLKYITWPPKDFCVQTFTIFPFAQDGKFPLSHLMNEIWNLLHVHI